MKDRNEEKLKRVAGYYAKKEGESLLDELKEIERRNISYLTPRADRTVRELAATKTRQPSRRKMIFGLAATAACVLIAFQIVINVPGMPGGGASAPEAASSSADSGESPLQANEDEGEGVPSTGGSVPPIGSGGILSVSFVLPADYRISAEDYDNGMSIYEFKSDYFGDVVLTMHYETDVRIDADGTDIYADFDEVIIDGASVPAKINDSYMLLAFDREGLYYTLSSEDDMGSLAAFYRSIAV